MSDWIPSPKQTINQQSLKYWLEKKGDRPMPSRNDLDPVEIPGLLPHVILLDVMNDPRDFRYRLIGTIVEHHLLHNLAGLRMREIAHQAPGSIIWSTLEDILANKRPVTSSIPYVGPHNEYKTAEDLIMPLSDDGEAVNMMFVTVAYSKR